MATSGQKPPIDVQFALQAARAERSAVESREVERDPEILTEVDLLFALEAILERADKVRQEVERALSAVDMATNQAPDDSSVAALGAHAVETLTCCEEWLANSAHAVKLSTRRLVERRQAVKLRMRH